MLSLLPREVWGSGTFLLSQMEILRYCEPQTTVDMGKRVEILAASGYKHHSEIHNISKFYSTLAYSGHCPISAERFARLSSRNFNFMRTGSLLALFTYASVSSDMPGEW